MLFPTHLAGAALLGRPTRLPVPWLVLGGALPDLVDKPLGALGVFELYHTMGHSLLFLIVVGPLALLGRAGLSVLVGWASHLLLDAVHVVVNGRPEHLAFLGWPVLVPEVPLGIPPGPFILYYAWTPSFYLDLLLLGLAAVVAVRERRAVGRFLSRLGRGR